MTGADDEPDAELERMRTLDQKALRQRWLELKGVPLPKFMRREMMFRAIAHAVQEKALGGLDPVTAKKLAAHVAAIIPTGAKPPATRMRIKFGTRLVREWRGEVYEVVVEKDTFVWKGKSHRSLSVIARLITGTRWNGLVFFGLKGSGKAALKNDSGRFNQKSGTASGRSRRRQAEVAHG